MMEFKMTTDLQTALPAEIAFNFEELKADLAERLTYYKGMVVTEDGIKDAKEDRAKLNKLREAIETRRKEIKKQCMQPYTVFEAKVKELTGLIDEPIKAIDSQLKAYEEAAKAEKQQAIREYYEANVQPHMQLLMPLERIQKPDWLNKTKDMKKIQFEIVEALARVVADTETLNNLDLGQFTAAVRAKYAETLDISATLAHLKALQKAQEAFGESQDQTVAPVEKPAAAQPREAVKQDPVASEEKVYLLRLQFQITMDQANALKKFLADNNIHYEKI